MALAGHVLKKRFFMAQKSNPVSLRLEKTNKHWNSCWYGDYNYTTQCVQDCGVQFYMENICQQAKIASPVISLYRERQEMRALFFFPRAHIMRKTRAKPAKIFSITEQKTDWFSESISRYKKRKEKQIPFNRELVSYERVFRHLLLCVFSLESAVGRSQFHEKYALLGNENALYVDSSSAKERKEKSVKCWKVDGFNYTTDQSSIKEKKNPFSSILSTRKDFSLVEKSLETRNMFDESRKKLRPQLSSVPKNSFYQTATPLKNHLEESLFSSTKMQCKVQFFICPSAHQNPLFLATQVVSSLEERIPFRRLKHRLIGEIQADSGIKGVRITCSGRVAARSKKAQKAKSESIQWGQTSLHVFSDLVHFASKSALTGFGKIGVKVWICYH